MRRVVEFIMTLAISLAALTVVITPSSATAYEGETKLSLTTDYLFEKVAGGYWLRLNVTLDDRFRGKGTLEIDPNTQGFNNFGDPTSVTEIATKIVNITLEAIKLNDPAKKGRHLWEMCESCISPPPRQATASDSFNGSGFENGRRRWQSGFSERHIAVVMLQPPENRIETARKGIRR